MYLMQNRTTIQVENNLRKELKLLSAKRDITYQDLLKDMISIFSELDKDKTIISIPNKLAEKMKDKIESTDFNSISEYVTFILRLLLYEEAKSEKINEKKIKSRLKELGYI